MMRKKSNSNQSSEKRGFRFLSQKMPGMNDKTDSIAKKRMNLPNKANMTTVRDKGALMIAQKHIRSLE